MCGRPVRLKTHNSHPHPWFSPGYGARGRTRDTGKV